MHHSLCGTRHTKSQTRWATYHEEVLQLQPADVSAGGTHLGDAALSRAKCGNAAVQVDGLQRRLEVELRAAACVQPPRLVDQQLRQLHPDGSARRHMSSVLQSITRSCQNMQQACKSSQSRNSYDTPSGHEMVRAHLSASQACASMVQSSEKDSHEDVGRAGMLKKQHNALHVAHMVQGRGRTAQS